MNLHFWDMEFNHFHPIDSKEIGRPNRKEICFIFREPIRCPAKFYLGMRGPMVP